MPRKKIGKQICPKCANEEIRISYHTDSYNYLHRCNYFDHSKSDLEHLHYYCKVCDYDWTVKISG